MEDRKRKIRTDSPIRCIDNLVDFDVDAERAESIGLLPGECKAKISWMSSQIIDHVSHRRFGSLHQIGCDSSRDIKPTVGFRSRAEGTFRLKLDLRNLFVFSHRHFRPDSHVALAGTATHLSIALTGMTITDRE